MAAPFDTLKLARALRDKAGFSQEHAEATADALADTVGGRIATRQDIADIHGEVAAPRPGMRAEFAAVRTEFTAGLRDVEQRITPRLGGMLVVVTGILLAAKFFS